MQHDTDKPPPANKSLLVLAGVLAVLGLALVSLDPLRHEVEDVVLEVDRPPLRIARPTDEPRILEYLEVLRDRLDAHVVGLGEFAHRGIGHAEPGDDVPAGRVRECRERLGQVVGVVVRGAPPSYSTNLLNKTVRHRAGLFNP